MNQQPAIPTFSQSRYLPGHPPYGAPVHGQAPVMVGSYPAGPYHAQQYMVQGTVSVNVVLTVAFSSRFSYLRGRRKDFLQGGAIVDFSIGSQKQFPVGVKVVKLRFNQSKLRKQLFLLKI